MEGGAENQRKEIGDNVASNRYRKTEKQRTETSKSVVKYRFQRPHYTEGPVDAMLSSELSYLKPVCMQNSEERSKTKYAAEQLNSSPQNIHSNLLLSKALTQKQSYVLTRQKINIQGHPNSSPYVDCAYQGKYDKRVCKQKSGRSRKFVAYASY